MLLSSNSKEKEAKKRYEALEAPPWLSLLAHEKLGTWKHPVDPNGFHLERLQPPLSKFRMENEPIGRFRSFCLETKDQMLMRLENVPYQEMVITGFPFYHRRLRELRLYMDYRKHRGLIGLMKDKRNSSTFWNFWCVVIFGVASVFLAIHCPRGRNCRDMGPGQISLQKSLKKIDIRGQALDVISYRQLRRYARNVSRICLSG